MDDDTAGKRLVYLDPDGSGTDQGWVFVIIAAPTGVVYQHQGGGLLCRQYQQEGYLIPFFGRDLDQDLKEIFIGRLRTFGSQGLDWPPELIERLRSAVADFAVYGSANHDDLYPTSLVLDQARIAETDEAWVRVITPDGSGVLVWENSD